MRWLHNIGCSIGRYSRLSPSQWSFLIPSYKYLIPCHQSLQATSRLHLLLGMSASISYAGISMRFVKHDALNQENDSEEYIINVIKRAILSQQKGDAKMAEQQLHLALKMAQETMNDEAITYIYDVMANLAHEMGRWDDAERLFIETSKRLVQGGMTTDDDAIIEISMKVADIFTEKGKMAEAESGFLYCLETLQKKLSSGINDDNTVMLWAMCADAYGKFLLRVGQHQEAGRHFKEALDACKRIVGLAHPQTLVLMNNLGNASYMSGNYEEAAEHMRNAANIASTTGSTDLSAYYSNLGMVYLQLGRIKEAESACRKALETASKDKNFEHTARQCLEDIILKKKVPKL